MGKKPLVGLKMEPREMVQNIYDELKRCSGVPDPDGKNRQLWLDYLREQDYKLSENFKHSGNPGDYASRAVQAMYLLHYLNCYAYGYRDMYLKFFSDYHEKLKSPDIDRLRVLSIGCGNQIDDWGLYKAGEHLSVEKEYSDLLGKLSYRGVDLDEWEKDFLISPNTFIQKDAVNLINSSWTDSYLPSVYVFARSISEFYDSKQIKDGKLINGMAELYIGLTKLLEKHREQKRIWVLLNLRVNKYDNYWPYTEDIDRCRKICESVEKAGYIWKGGLKPLKPWHELFRSDSEASITDLECFNESMYQDSVFKYPDKIRSELESLKIYPMSKRKNIYYWITYFEREEKGGKEA